MTQQQELELVGSNIDRRATICESVGIQSSWFLSGFGPRGVVAICNLVGGGGMALSTCTALDNVAESGGILNPPPSLPPPPPNFESFLFRASCVISGLKNAFCNLVFISSYSGLS